MALIPVHLYFLPLFSCFTSISVYLPQYLSIYLYICLSTSISLQSVNLHLYLYNLPLYLYNVPQQPIYLRISTSCLSTYVSLQSTSIIYLPLNLYNLSIHLYISITLVFLKQSKNLFSKNGHLIYFCIVFKSGCSQGIVFFGCILN